MIFVYCNFCLIIQQNTANCTAKFMRYHDTVSKTEYL